MAQKYEANLTPFSNSPYSHDAKKNFFFRFLGPGGGPKLGGAKNVTNPPPWTRDLHMAHFWPGDSIDPF